MPKIFHTRSLSYKNLMELKNDKIEKAEKILADAEVNKRELTEDEAAELAEIRDDVKRIKEALKIGDELDDSKDKQPKQEPAPAGGEPKPTQEQQERRAFENYIRGRIVHERAGELTKTDNGSVIPATIAQQIIKKVYDISPILEKSQKYNVKGKLQIPYYDTTDGGITVAYAEEFKPLTSSNGKFKNIELDGFLAGALSKISNSLINNSQFDIVSFVVNQMAEDIARFIEHELLIGTSDKVTGLSTMQNKVTAAAANAITSDEVVKLKDSIKDVYQSNAIWIMSTATRTALRLLKGSDGHYLLQDDITSPFGSTLLGKPVYVSDNMPEIKADATAIYYGDMTGLATKFSENITTQVLREKYADEHATGVVAWFEFDSKVQNEQKFAKLVMASA
ncbi:MAG: capsid family protein [Bacteriophage sp.]|nr:MAG: capsid family protein [Bacteriophage sp.]